MTDVRESAAVVPEFTAPASAPQPPINPPQTEQKAASPTRPVSPCHKGKTSKPTPEAAGRPTRPTPPQPVHKPPVQAVLPKPPSIRVQPMSSGTEPPSRRVLHKPTQVPPATSTSTQAQPLGAGPPSQPPPKTTSWKGQRFAELADKLFGVAVKHFDLGQHSNTCSGSCMFLVVAATLLDLHLEGHLLTCFMHKWHQFP